MAEKRTLDQRGAAEEPGTTPDRQVQPEVRLGISTCLLGEKVRYDGGHGPDRFLVQTLGQFVEWVPVCPEVEMGLPIPREAVWLVGDPENPRLIAPKSGLDHTEAMQTWARARVEQLVTVDLHGFVFKKTWPQSALAPVQVDRRLHRR